MIARATVDTTSPLTVWTPAAATSVPATLPASPSISLSAGDRVLVAVDERELIVIARLP